MDGGNDFDRVIFGQFDKVELWFIETNLKWAEIACHSATKNGQLTRYIFAPRVVHDN